MPPRPVSPVCLPPATSPTTSIARRSPAPVPAAWPRSTRKRISRRTPDARREIMAKLSELKALLAKANQAPKPRAQVLHAAPVKAPTNPRPADVDLREVFADVAPLRATNRVARRPQRPPPQPAQRLADEAEALSASQHGVAPSPSHWEVGQEVEAEQTFLRNGLGVDVLTR